MGRAGENNYYTQFVGMLIIPDPMELTMDVLQKIWKYYMISWIMILLDIYSKE
jgi:hypothetical protein